jgi:hypothetical protein
LCRNRVILSEAKDLGSRERRFAYAEMLCASA